MRILLLTGDVWNDITNGNNIYSNWFDGFDAEFANIYLGPGIPHNSICTKYFQITDKMMARSLISSTKAGQSFFAPVEGNEKSDHLGEERDSSLYSKLKLFSGEPLRLLRDILWNYGRIDVILLKKFIDDFNPDIVFCTHLFSIKYRRIERLIHSLTPAPMVAFTGDAEASLMNFNLNPLFWIRQLVLCRLYPSHVRLFSHYFTFSERQCESITKKYGVPSSTLYKCANILQESHHQSIHNPVKIVYAGRLYCNRWKTLSVIGDALENINNSGTKAELLIFSPETLSKKQEKALSKKGVRFMGYIAPSRLSDVYRDADIALHVESFDKKYKYATIHSFSTKIIDLMSSGCAIMAICWNQNNGWQYLKKEDAAICISQYKDILPKLSEIVKMPSIINEYALKAIDCGLRNHSRDMIHSSLYGILENVIKDNRSV